MADPDAVQVVIVTTDETEAGRRYLRFARTAEREGNIKSARMYLGLALEVEPQNQAVRELLERVTRKL